MAFFSVMNKLKIRDVTLTSMTKTNPIRLKSLDQGKNLFKKILYETRPHKLEIGLFRPSLNYTYKPTHVQETIEDINTIQRSNTIQRNNTIQRINTIQCNNIYNNTVQFRVDTQYNPILQRFDTIQANVIHNTCDAIQNTYKFNSRTESKREPNNTIQHNDLVKQNQHVQQSKDVQKNSPCDTLQLYDFSQQLMRKKYHSVNFMS